MSLNDKFLKVHVMLAAGIILFITGLTFRLILNLSAHYERDILSPRRMSERISALDLIFAKRRMLLVDANILMVAGLLTFLITGIFN